MQPLKNKKIVSLGRRGLSAAAAAWLLLAWGCASVPTRPLDPSSLVLRPESRILLAKVEKQAFEHRLEPLSGLPALPEQILVVGLDSAWAGADLGALVAERLAGTAADMALLFETRRIVEKRYNPYRVFKGWRTESVIDGYESGRPVTRKQDVPRFETEYRNRCVRIRYRILQYGPGGEPMGQIEPESAAPRRCPDRSDKDVLMDEFESAARWLEAHVRVAP